MIQGSGNTKHMHQHTNRHGVLHPRQFAAKCAELNTQRRRHNLHSQNRNLLFQTRKGREENFYSAINVPIRQTGLTIYVDMLRATMEPLNVTLQKMVVVYALHVATSVFLFGISAET